MSDAHAVQRLETQGYVVLEDAIDADLVARLKAELAPWLQGRHYGRNDFEGHCSERVYALLAKAPAVAELIGHTDVLALVDAFLPSSYLLSAALAINVHPGETPQAWHIDDAAGSMGHHLFDRPRAPLGVSAIWALDAFTDDNGATEVIPGSHRWSGAEDPTDDAAVKVLMPAGSVVVFAGNLVHRGGANRSRGTRLAITPQYCAPFLRQIENMPLAVPPEQAARYDARIQSLLGYSVIEPGFMGYVDGRHPKRLLAQQGAAAQGADGTRDWAPPA